MDKRIFIDDQEIANRDDTITTDKFASLSNDLTKYITENFIQPQVFDNLDKLKAAYPYGTNGVFVTIDTGHFYFWQNNAWKDCGVFQSTGIANNSIYIDKLSSSLQNSFYPEVEEIKADYIPGFLEHWHGTVKLGEPDDPKDGGPVHTNVIAVKPGEEYYIYTQNYWDGKAITFYNQSQIVSVLPAENDNLIKYMKITIPNNANGIVLNGTYQCLPRLFKVNYYFEISQPMESIANLIKNKDYDFEKVELTKKAEVGYWDITRNGNFSIKPVDKTQAQISYEPIKVEPFEVYRISGCTAWDARLYEIIDAQGKLIDYCPTVKADQITETVMIPENGAYLEINEFLLNDHTTLEKADSVREGSSSVKEELPLNGKAWTALGDSWTQIFSDQNRSYVNDVAAITGLTATNSGAGGTGYITGGADNWNNQFYKHPIETDSDVVTMFGSFNDSYDPDFKFGQEGDTKADTLWGALQVTLNHVYQSAFDAQVGIIAPGPWGSINQHSSSDLKISTHTTFKDPTVNSMSIADFAEKYVQVLHDFADLNSLPFLDLYHHSGLRPWDPEFANKYYHGTNNTDTTHPNANTMKLIIAPKIAKFIESFA